MFVSGGQVSEGLPERATVGQSANRPLSARDEIPERMPPLDTQERRSATTRVLVGLAVAIAYVGTAQLGFRLAFVAEQITTVWAPTGNRSRGVAAVWRSAVACESN